MDKYKTSEKIEEWIKEKLKNRSFKDYELLKNKILKRDNHIDTKNDGTKIMNVRYNHKARAKETKNKNLSAIDTKRGETEVRRRPKVIEKPYVSSLFSPGNKPKYSTSQSNYNQFETFDHHTNSQSDFKHNMSLETLNSLKEKRLSRKTNHKRVQKILKEDTSPLEIGVKSNSLILPDAVRSAAGNLYKSNLESVHIKANSNDLNGG